MKALLVALSVAATPGSSAAKPPDAAAVEDTQEPKRANAQEIERDALEFIGGTSDVDECWGQWGIRAPRLVLRDAWKKGERTHAAAVGALARAYRVPTKTAEVVVRAEIESVARYRGGPDASDEEIAAPITAALARAKDDPLLFAELLAHASYKQQRAVWTALEATASPVKTALRFAAAKDYKFQSDLLAYALLKDPSTAPSVAAIAVRPDAETHVELLVRLFEAHREKLPLALRAKVLHRLVERLGDHRPMLAWRMFQLADAETQADAVARAPSEPDSDVPIELSLAVGALVSGSTDRAKALVARAQPRKSPCAAVVLLKVLRVEVGLDAKLEDPYATAQAALTCRFDGDAARIVTWSLLKTAYPEAAKDELAVWPPSPEEEKLEDQPFTDLLADEHERLEADLTVEQQQLVKMAAHLEQESEDRPKPKKTSGEPPLIADKPLPKEIEPFDFDKQRDCCEEPKVKLPRGFWPVRVEQSEKTVRAIALSQNIDPTGEVSGGGYWFLESVDGGATWKRKLYTGLREYRPYEVAPQSKLPLVDGAVVQLEVRVRALDYSSVTFPPVERRFETTRTGVYVSLPFAMLEKDSDSDGLTDLVEQRLLLDPNKADTDGDGVRDAVDPSPRSARTKKTPNTEMMEAVLQAIEGSAPPGIIPGKDSLAQPIRLREPIGEGRVLFVERSPDLDGVESSTPMILLTPEEETKAAKTFGPFYPASFEVRLRSEDGKRVTVEWSEHWRGGTVAAELKDGKWIVKILESWIT